MEEMTYTLETRKGGIVMLTNGFIVGVFSNETEAALAWPKIKFNLTNNRVNLRYATLKYVRPELYLENSRKNKGKR